MTDNNKKVPKFIFPGDTGDLERMPIHGGGHQWVSFGPRPRGAPTEKDWQGCLHYLIARAMLGELKTEHHQLTIEILGWFTDQDKDVADSMARNQATAIRKQLKAHGIIPTDK